MHLPNFRVLTAQCVTQLLKIKLLKLCDVPRCSKFKVRGFNFHFVARHKIIWGKKIDK